MPQNTVYTIISVAGIAALQYLLSRLVNVIKHLVVRPYSQKQRHSTKSVERKSSTKIKTFQVTVGNRLKYAQNEWSRGEREREREFQTRGPEKARSPNLVRNGGMQKSGLSSERQMTSDKSNELLTLRFVRDH